jgi:hypothetical protein
MEQTLLVNNATRTVIQSAVKFPNSNIAIDFAETSLMPKKGVDKRRTDGGRRTADDGRRTTDGGRRTADDGPRSIL